MMTEADFWGLIADTKKLSNGDTDEQEDIIRKELARLEIADFHQFFNLYLHFHRLAETDELMYAAIAINYGCGDDSFIDFRDWLILQGQEVFYAALNNPETLIDVAEYDKTFAVLYSRIHEAYYLLTGEEDLPYPEENDFEYAQIQEKWHTLEEAYAMFPALYEKFGNIEHI